MSFRYRRPTVKKFVGALLNTAQRYQDGFMCESTFHKHMTAMWQHIEQSPRGARLVRRALNVELARMTSRVHEVSR